ncbi:MAG: DNA methyltransferase [Methylococcaceae bacterium]
MAVTVNFNTLRQRASQFAKDFEGVKSEKERDQDFMRGFCKIFGINPNRIDWQYKVKETDKAGKKSTTTFIDGVLRGMMLIEMKSAGKDLDDAYLQASRYASLMNEQDRPDYILVSDFTNLHLYNRLTGAPRIELKLADLPQQIEPFLFLANYETIAIEQQVHINKEAAETMAKLHDALKATGYNGKDLETYLVRLLFCLFAEDTGLFGENGVFLDYLVNHTQADGSDLHGSLMSLFDTLNKPDDSYLQEHANYTGVKRLKNLPEHRAKFPYINGQLFAGTLAECCFDEAARKTLIDCANLDWSNISPAIFGSLFQAIMHFEDEAAAAKSKKRREFGAHYTSEENILKVINPLFMDDLRKEFAKCGKTPAKLGAFHNRLAALNFFDPACGCGNFLVIAYRELRLLELEVIQKLFGNNLTAQLDVDTLIRCNVDQFNGIEIDDSAAQIATVALWLTDHQMNTKVQSLGLYYHRIPLVKKANIVCANALRIDWNDVLPAEKCSFVMGNPPFVGYSYQSKEQKADLTIVFKGMNGPGVLDLVAAWHITAARYIQANPKIPVAFVSTNSLTQGEQVAILWTELLKLNIKLHFAHRTFRWSNEGKGVAAVHCVIMGFHHSPVGANLFAQSSMERANKFAPTICRLFDYGDDIAGEPIEIQVKQINPYLVDAPTVLIEKRRKPLCINIPNMANGGKPTEGGHLLLSASDANTIGQSDLIAAKYIRPFLMGDEFINGIKRYCLWLKDSTAQDRKLSPEIQRRMLSVKAMRQASTKIATQKLAETPYLFGEIRTSSTRYLAIPKVSSERRAFIPIGYLDADVICGDKLFFIPDASLLHFGVLTSHMHNAWMRTTCGRLKSDYSYSNTIVYNNFPWPQTINPTQQAKIETAAQLILDARTAEENSCAEQGQKCSLATLYAAGNMPTDLLKAHNALDKAVDAAYGYKGGKDDAARVAFLFEQYQKLIAQPQAKVTKEPKTSAKKPMAELS